MLVLAAVAGHGLIPPVTVLIDGALDPSVAVAENRVAALTVAMGCPVAGFRLLDLRTLRTAGPRRLLEILCGGGSVVMFADARFVPPTTSGAITCVVGQRTLGFPRGAAWLERMSGCRVGGVVIRPERDSHRVAFHRADSVEAAVARLFGEMVIPEPGPWQGWLGAGPFP